MENCIINKAYINGKWVDAQSGLTLEVTNPATGDVIGTIPNMRKIDAEIAVQAAKEAFVTWSKTTAAYRGDLMRKWFDSIIEHKDMLAYYLTLEQGKPLKEAKGEIVYGASYIEWFAEEAKRIYGDIIPATNIDQQIMVTKQAIGVCAAVTPWNFPNAMITRKVAPALAAGCTFIIRPASETPYSALLLAKLAEEVGIPKGVFNVITGDAKEIGKVLTESPDVQKFSFTGSTPVGRLLMAQSASTVKKVSLELGGNAPFIVFDDADIDKAVEGAVLAKFRNAGQTCVCANRIYVHSKIYSTFVEKFTQVVRTLKVGNGLTEDVDIGPLISQKALDKVWVYINDAKEKGGQIEIGGNSLSGLFFEPTVISHANDQMLFTKEEIFGPIAPIYSFDTEEEVIKRANDTEYGLAAYVYSQNLGTVMRVTDGLEYGIIGVNTGLISNATAPFGGMKQSGLGREGSKYGIEDYLEIKYISVNW
ncbi:NAD-dependent succinate-semialdehyde dehydrogenase [Basilea psittacipulmonis]|uniref:Succinate-semialdehyde dehydrogenase n=1 Tax=Basilea psittacipulmonis DSM 24701 TaxID=1072685 RepID=A0A077DAK9_9BURK|nr:NAD-dependent succinate-semialdehyde dehydrogenase [Basilea psittacipulmonis]AIL31925.1 succinate-semialdehyde dehydrogenase [Basilea psittacipulmonis DSM 24701]